MPASHRLVERAPAAPRLRSTLVRRAALALAVLVVVSGVLAARVDAFIYWSTSGTGSPSIGRANTDGSDANNTFAFTQDIAEGVAVDSVYIYWTNSQLGTIGRAFLNGSNVNQGWLPVGGLPEGLALDGRHIYWTNGGDAGQSTIGRADIDGTNIDDSFITGATFDTGGLDPNGVALDKPRTHIYWGNGTSGTIGSANLDNNGDVSEIDQSFVSGAGVVLGVAVDPDNVFWADGLTDTVGAANLGSRFPNTSFISATDGIDGVAVDNTFVYWTNSSLVRPQSSSIGRAELSGQNANQQFIALPPDTSPVAVAVDPGLTTSPPPTIASLIDEVTEEGLPHGTERSLLAKLEGAQRKLDAGNVGGACGSLGAYINQVRAQAGKRFETDYAEVLILAATAVRESISC
jgi:virginiamycin B lyase